MLSLSATKMVAGLGFSLSPSFTLRTRRLSPSSLQKPSISSSARPSVRLVRHSCLVRSRLWILPPKATEQQGQATGDEVVDSKILPYCSIDKKAEKKTIGEMEQEFLQALQAFYYDKEAIMSNEEFDNLKEELMWEGSSVVMLSSDEQKFLEASMAYVAGKPILTDEEFDQLKLRLKQEGSSIVQEGPRCSLRTRKLPEPFSFIFTWFAAVPLIVWLSLAITNVIIKDFLILKGACPNCGTENLSFFGNILSVPSGDTNTVKCSNCGTALEYDSRARLITVDASKA